MGRLSLPPDLGQFKGRRTLHLEAFGGTVMSGGQWTRLPASKMGSASANDIEEGRFAILETRAEETGFKDFMLLDEQGRGLRVNFTHGPVPVKGSDQVSIVTSVRRHRKRGGVLLLINHTTGARFSDRVALADMNRTVLPWFALAALLVGLLCLPRIAVLRLEYPPDAPPAIELIDESRVQSIVSLKTSDGATRLTNMVVAVSLVEDAAYGFTGRLETAMHAGRTVFMSSFAVIAGLGGFFEWLIRRRSRLFLEQLEHWLRQAVRDLALEKTKPTNPPEDLAGR